MGRTAGRLSPRPKRLLRWVAADHPRTQGRSTSSPQDLVRTLQRDKGNLSQSLRPLAERGWMVIGRSSGGQAASLRLTPEGQTLVSQFTGSGDARENAMETRGESL